MSERSDNNPYAKDSDATAIPTSNAVGFIFLNITQFCGAANDNVLKQLLIFGVAAGGLWADKLGEGAQAYASLCLAIPFVILSGFAGQFADRFSKRDLSIVVKLSEVVIATLAAYGLWIQNVWLVLGSLVLISVQSAFFSPAKFGILPELLPEEKLSRANGTINMFTYVAIILGSAVGGPLYDYYAPTITESIADSSSVEPMLWLPGAVLLVIGIVGTAASFGLPKLQAKNPALRLKPIFFRAYVETWREIKGTPIVSVLVAWSYFYLIVGGFAILILPDYKKLLETSATNASILMAILGISTGVGDYIAGRISGHKIRTDLISFGAIGVTISFFVLGVIPMNYSLVAVCLALCGFTAGFIMVPLQTMVQKLTPEERRGRALGLWSCLSFVGVILGNFAFLAVKATGVASNRVFLVCGVLGLIYIALHYLVWLPQFTTALAAQVDASPAETAKTYADES